MTPKSLADKIEGLIISTNDTFATRIIGVQNRLYNDLVLVLKNIEVDGEGYILQSAANRKILSEAIFKIDESFTEGTPYVNAIQKHLEIIPDLNSLNNSYFETISSGFTPNKNFIKSLQRQTISTLENTLLNDGLQAQVKSPLVDILNRNINTGGSFNGFLKEVQNFVKGNEKVEGKILSYSKTYVRDALFTYARSYQQSITSDLGLEWYLYAGGLMDTSREFCIERSERYFHEQEIKSWASLSWQGKKQGTTESSIFVFCGGWQCNHQLIPVHISAVPQDDLDRIA
jgi:hypothetical protein